MKKYFSYLVACALLWSSCGNANEQKLAEINGLEQRFTAEPSSARCDSLINLYKAAVKSNPDDHTNNLRFLTRAAEIQYEFRDDAAPSVRWLDDALGHHAAGQNLTSTIGLLARIWNSYNYKAATAVKMGPDDIDKMRAYLQKNQQWMDSALVQLDQKMVKDGIVVDKKAMNQFIEIAEGYASLTDSPEKFVDLLMKAAGLAKTGGEFNKALQMYYKISNRLPDHPKAKTALFMQGFIYENDLQDLEKAKKTYEFFLEKYPNDPDYADDAQMALKTLGKSPEEIIKGFK